MMDEKETHVDSVAHHDDVPDIDQVVQIAHETGEKNISPWTWPMFRLYLVLSVAYLCGYVVFISLCYFVPQSIYNVSH